MFSVLQECSKRGHEQVSFFNYPEVGLKAIVAIHDTTLGPALGGCRVRAYDTEEQAVEDVMRLSEGMTYKSSLAGLPLGGGKACIIADPHLTQGREALFKKFGECLNHLNGRYITAEDMGTSVEDIMWIRSKTSSVVGTDPAKGGAGDPSPWTARGVFYAMQAACERVFESDKSLRGKRIAVQGIGHVGMYLVEYLVNEGAIVTVTDTNKSLLAAAASRFGVQVIDNPAAIYDVPMDIFSPCAVGQTVNAETIKRLGCSIIAGAANNQLPDTSMYSVLTERGVTYCPDFAINSGGVICVCAEYTCGDSTGAVAQPHGALNTQWVTEKVRGIYDTTLRVLDEAAKRGRFTEEVAIELAKERIAAAKKQSSLVSA